MTHINLTPREQDVLCLMAQGLTNQQIADRLFLSKDSVRAVVRSINNKLGTPKQETSTATRQATIDIALRHNLCTEAKTESNTPNNLSHETTTFIGRTQELSDLSDLLAVPSNRLISIIASGGMGKTRLALTLAHRQLPNFKDGVFFVPLQAITTEQGLINEIGSQMGILFQNDPHSSPLQQLLTVLKDKQRLLVLDNFEQLLDHVHIINEILKHAPQLNIIITSRERLKLKGEVVYRLSGLSQNTEAIDLFVDSLQHIRPNIEFDDDDISIINQICQLVEGLPLALILASNWIEALSLPEIADEISESLDLLSEDMGDAQGIRAVFNRTWDRLSQQQQLTLMMLSVCNGGFTRDAITHMTKATLIDIRKLTDKSLLRLSESQRYDMHELLRQYFYEKANESAIVEMAQLHRAHYYSDFVQACTKDILDRHQMTISGYKLLVDSQNVIDAWYWSLDNEEYDLISQMVIGLSWMNQKNVNTSESVIRCYEILLQQPAIDKTLRYRAIIMYAQYIEMHHYLMTMSLKTLEPLLQDALIQAESNQDSLFQTIALSALATIMDHSNPARIQLFEQSLAIAIDNNYKVLAFSIFVDLTNALSFLDMQIERDKWDRSRFSLELAQSTGDIDLIAQAFHNQVIEGFHVVDYSMASHYLKEIDRILNQENSFPSDLIRQQRLAEYYHAYGSLMRFTGNHASAIDAFTRALALADNFGDSWVQNYCYLGLITSVIMVEEYNQASELLQHNIEEEPYMPRATALCRVLLNIGLKNFNLAQQYLKLRHQIRSSSKSQKIVTICAAIIILMHDEEYEKAVRYFSFVSQYPQSPQSMFSKWKPYVTSVSLLKSSLPDDLYTRAWDNGKALDLEDIMLDMSDWLEEFELPDDPYFDRAIQIFTG